MTAGDLVVSFLRVGKYNSPLTVIKFSHPKAFPLYPGLSENRKSLDLNSTDSANENCVHPKKMKKSKK
jgi:hypothetical protein